MSQTLDEFRASYLEEIRNDSRIEGMTPSEFFFSSMLGRLEAMGEVDNPQEITTCVDKICRKGRKMSVDAYSFDESDKSLSLFISDYIDSTESAVITKTDVLALCNKMLYFLEEVYDGTLGQFFDDSNEILQIARTIETRLKRDYVDYGNDISLHKIKLFIITNKKLSEKIKSFDLGEFKGKRIEVNVWSIQRIYDILLSGKDKESIVVDIQEFGFDGIPCIKAEMSNATDYDAFLAIIPGQLLHAIYHKFGSRLLEGNVRAFLSMRGKINKGIRNTILREPTKFFTYNNGIACTAAKVELDSSGSKIIRIDDLQIINGGQTTASLTAVFLDKKSNANLENIFIPLKMTVVKNDDYDTVIANIARYANSQNKVTDADMFSNHPFHRRFEELANKIVAPAKDGSLYDTFWYYERARGKYEQEQFKLTPAQKVSFERKKPKKQVIKKEELAKYYMAANELRPDIVSRGSQKCMQAFAVLIDKKFENNAEMFNESFYRKAICYAILYRETDRIVQKANWYNVGGYKLNIVPYTIAKMISLIPNGYCLDFNKIWRKQALPWPIIRMLKKIAFVTNEYIQRTSSGVIVTEHCKKEETWNKYKTLRGMTEYMTDEFNLGLDTEFINDLIAESLIRGQEDSDRKDEKLTTQVNVLLEIYKFGSDYWSHLIKEGTERRLLIEKEISIMGLIAGDKPVSEKQAYVAWQAREKLDNAGVIV